MTAVPKTEDTAWPWLAHYPAEMDWRAEIPVKPLYALLDDTVAKHAQHPAFNFMGKRTTYGELGKMVDRFACGLKKLIKPGDRVGLLLPNCVYYPVAYFAILKCGGTVVNCNPLYTESELKHQILDSGAQIMVTIDVTPIAAKLIALADVCKLNTVVFCPMADILPFPTSLLSNWPSGKTSPRSRRTPGSSITANWSPMTAISCRIRSIPIAISRCCNIPAAPPACPRARC